jgi:hypothetical protein
MPTSKVHPARSVVPAATASKSTKASAAKAKTSNSPSAGKGLPRKARKPASLPNSDGDAGVQAYIASMEPWQAAIAKRVDALVVKHVPGVRKAVRWHCPFYGVEGQGWFLAFSGFQHHVKFSFFKGTSLNPVPPIGQFKDVRYLDVRESDGSGGRFPGGVFTSVALAEEWIRSNGLTGVLTEYPLDVGCFDWALANGWVGLSAEKLQRKAPDPSFIGSFSTASQEHFHYEGGCKV